VACMGGFYFIIHDIIEANGGKIIAPELAELAGVNLEEYGLAMLKAGTNLASKSAEELIDIDAMTFELNGNNVRVAQVNTVDIAEVLERQAEIEAAMQAANESNGYSDLTEGSIGFWLKNALQNALLDEGIEKNVASVVTQVVVDKNDPAFVNLSKPIGPFYSE
ncbi:hypothetical protein K8353_42070, partial [Burkholderia contaminans]|nr:hypothetical protein [Burkholderia contaminans]